MYYIIRKRAGNNKVNQLLSPPTIQFYQLIGPFTSYPPSLMSRMQHTNIIIDDFSISKRFTNRVFTHILTHIHTDHLKGLHDGWNYGPIYCTEQTKNMLLFKFPSLTCLRTIKINEPTVLKMSNSLEVTVTFFDANHCVGAVMVLLQGYMGRILYTGDIRFDRAIFQQYTHLYPPERNTLNFQACSKPIDVLYLDNTFLKKKFNFPPKHETMQSTIDFVQNLLDKNEHSRIFIGLDSIGKQQVFVELAQHFGMYVVVDEQRYQLLKVMGFDPQLFTTNPSQGIVEVVRKNKLYKCLQQCPNSIGIVLSGWVNHATYRNHNKIYCLPYSLHSNYNQIHQFVNSIRPSFIYPIVHQYPDQNKLFYSEKEKVQKKQLLFQEGELSFEDGYQGEIQELRKKYYSEPTEEYKMITNDIQLQKKIEEELLPPKILEFSSLGSEKNIVPIHMQTMQRKKYKLDVTRNEQEITRLKNKIQIKKKMQEGEKILEIQDEAVEQRFHKKKHDRTVIDLEDQEHEKREDSVLEIVDSKEQIFEEEQSQKLFSTHQKAPKLELNNSIQIEKSTNLPKRHSVFKPKQKITVPLSQMSLASIQAIQILKTKEQILQCFKSHPYFKKKFIKKIREFK